MASIAPKLDVVQSLEALRNLRINPLTRKPVGQGRHIYAYCNIRTNQVIYSLDQTLRPYRNIKTLPDAGNNTKPPKLRKDLWRPLWTLTLPPGLQGEAQGWKAWEKLNALRYMHEIYWTPPKELSRLYTKEEIEEMQKKYDDRGGSKKESVFDIIKRDKKKLRLRSFMDQRANSIADLAAVLLEQENISIRRDNEEYYDHQQVGNMLERVERGHRGEIEVLQARIDELKAEIKKLVKETPEDKAAAGTAVVREMRERRRAVRRELKKAQEDREQIEHALLMSMSAIQQPISEPGSELNAEDAGAKPQRNAIEEQRLDMNQSQLEEQEQMGEERPDGEYYTWFRKPYFTMEGMTVSWQNLLDAEFASEWPRAVERLPMGVTRHTAPKPGVEPMLSALEYYQGKRRVKVINEEDIVRREVVGGVAESIIQQLIGEDAGAKRQMEDPARVQEVVEDVDLEEAVEAGEQVKEVR